MLSYYGGEPINSDVQLVSENEALNSESLSATGATHAFSISFDSTTRLVESSVSTSIRIVTPDWLVDSIEAGKLLDSVHYHPKYLLDSEENQQLLETINQQMSRQKELEKEQKDQDVSEI